MSTRRYVVVGSGGVGSALGGLLVASGVMVTLVARGAQLEALQRGESLARDKQPETRFLNGEIAAMGEALGIRTPLNRALVALIERASAERRGPGTMTAGEVGRQIEAVIHAEP